ncbi:MAG: 2OG-Fe(II) oxygenase [Caulobacteraceae bacterium]
MATDQEAASAFAEAKRIVTDGPEPFADALRLLERATSLGSGEAAAKLAHVIALGAGVKPDWDKSADLLRRAAEMGWTPALEELQLLAGSELDDPAALRARVDISEWVAPRTAEVISPSPHISVLRGFMTHPESAWVIARGRSRLGRATIAHDSVRVSEQRSNTAAGFQLFDMDLALVLLQQRIAQSINLPREWFETTALMHYAAGEQYARHVDYLDASRMTDEIARRGQRIATFLVYLNADFEGGETDFPRLGLRFKGNSGDAITWVNADAELGPDPRTLHAGLSPTKGEKWLLSQWVRDRPARWVTSP